MERRKIVYRNGVYQILKPKNGNGWHEYGERKNIHGLDELLKREEFVFEMPEEIEKEVLQYRKMRNKKADLYSVKIPNYFK